MTAPSISVVIPVRDAEPYVEAAIGSILQQSFTDLEVLVVDDGSRDGTSDICERLAARDGRIRMLTSPGAGISAALNHGIDAARAPLIARMDADDVALRDRLRIQCAFLAAHPQVVVVGGSVRTIGPRGEHLGEWRYATGAPVVAARMQHHCAVAHPTVVMRTAAVRELGGYRSTLDGSEDYDLWLRVLDAGGDIDNVPDILLDHRIHATSVSGSRGHRQRITGFAARVSHRLRLAGVPHTFADTGHPIDPELMWTEVPESFCLDLRLRWALWQRDGLAAAVGWDLDSAVEASFVAWREGRSGDEAYRAIRLLAADARRRHDPRVIRWWFALLRMDRSRAVRQLLRGAQRDSTEPSG